MLGQQELDEMLAKRDELNADVQSALDVQAESWGIKIISVEIREMTLTTRTMYRPRQTGQRYRLNLSERTLPTKNSKGL